MLLFIEHGGGRELYEELLAPYGVQFIGAPVTGLVHSVFAAASAAPVNLLGSEVYTSLDKGVIDAADYTVFSTNH